MGTIIIPNAIKREAGKLYYIDGQGNICVADMKQHKIKKPSLLKK